MSMTNSGDHVCDNCGQSVGNGAITEAVIVSDLDPFNPGMVRNLHFCRDRQEDGTLVKGCCRKILRSSVLKHYDETRESDA